MQIRLLVYLVLFALTVAIEACKQDFTPKPRAYYRIDLPKKEYQQLSGSILTLWIPVHPHEMVL